jgi:valyl-tRNA synthetase
LWTGFESKLFQQILEEQVPFSAHTFVTLKTIEKLKDIFATWRVLYLDIWISCPLEPFDVFGWTGYDKSFLFRNRGTLEAVITMSIIDTIHLWAAAIARANFKVAVLAVGE